MVQSNTSSLYVSSAFFIENPQGMWSTLHSTHGVVGRYMGALGQTMLYGAINQVGSRTGALRASLRLKHYPTRLGQEFTLGSNLPYAYMHHEGTRPHAIVPRRGPGSFLKFRSKGVTVYSPAVRHPGTRPNRYLSDQLKIIGMVPNVINYAAIVV